MIVVGGEHDDLVAQVGIAARQEAKDVLGAHAAHGGVEMRADPIARIDGFEVALLRHLEEPGQVGVDRTSDLVR